MLGHYPDVTISAGFRHHWHAERLVPSRGPDATGSFSRDIFFGDVSLTIPIFTGGRVVKATRAARWLNRAQKSKLARTREELVFKVRSTFFALLAMERLLSAMNAERAALLAHLRTTKELLKEKKAAVVDVIRIEARLASLDASMQEQLGLIFLGNTTLTALLGLSNHETPKGRLVRGLLTIDTPVLDIKKLTEQALSRRRDLKELVHRMRAQAAQVDVVRAAYLPSVHASISYNPRLSAGGDYDDMGFVGIAISYSILGWLGSRYEAAAASAELRALGEKRKTLMLQIQSDVACAVVRVRTAMAQIKATRVAIRKAREVLRIERQKALLGRGIVKDVLDAQAEVLMAETAYYQKLSNLHTAIALLDLATGKES